MRMHKKTIIFQCFMLFINIGTLFLIPPFSANLSDLGNQYGHRLYFIIWGCASASCFFYYTYKLMRKYYYPYRYLFFLLIASCSFMILSLLLPYLPQQYPQIAHWHTRLAITGTVMYLLIFYHLLFDIMHKDPKIFQIYFPKYTALILFCVFLYIAFGGVSTSMEITFSSLMSIMLPNMLYAT